MCWFTFAFYLNTNLIREKRQVKVAPPPTTPFKCLFSIVLFILLHVVVVACFFFFLLFVSVYFVSFSGDSMKKKLSPHPVGNKFNIQVLSVQEESSKDYVTGGAGGGGEEVHDACLAVIHMHDANRRSCIDGKRDLYIQEQLQFVILSIPFPHIRP